MKKYGIDIKWLAITSFEMRCGNTTIVTDPCITECVGTELTSDAVENCDIICLSHSHWDHITDIPRLVERFHPLIVCGQQTATPMAEWLDYSPAHIYPMYPDLTLDFDDVKIRALYGRHTHLNKGYNTLLGRLHMNQYCQVDPGMDALQGPGSMEYCNYLFTLPNGTKVLIWGNNPTVVQRNICKELQPDIAIIQRSAAEEDIIAKAEFAAAIGCKVLIPHHHHDFTKTEDPAIVERFREEFLARVPDGTFIAPAHGEWIHL